MLIGAVSLCEVYRRAVTTQGVAVDVLESTVMTLAGLTAAFRTMKEHFLA